MLHVEWYHVCWPRLTTKRVEPVVSISWASCLQPAYLYKDYYSLAQLHHRSSIPVQASGVVSRSLWGNYSWNDLAEKWLLTWAAHKINRHVNSVVYLCLIVQKVVICTVLSVVIGALLFILLVASWRYVTVTCYAPSAMLCVCYAMYSFLLVCNSNFVFNTRHFSDVRLKECLDLEIWIRGHSRSLYY